MPGWSSSMPAGEKTFLFCAARLETIFFGRVLEGFLMSLFAKSPRCGYCQNLSPTFKELASEMASWRDIIQVPFLTCDI